MNTAGIKMVSPGVHRLTIVISLLAIVIGPLLYLFPYNTDKLFSWTVLPPLTAMFLGGCYLSALVIERVAARETVWANARAIYPGMLIFTTLTLIGTLLHLDKFHFGSPAMIARLTAWAWLIVYAIAPVVMLALLVLQSRLPGADPQRIARLPRDYRAILMIQGVVVMALGAALFLAPQIAAQLWPWQLTPLTAAAVGSWLVGFGFSLGHSAVENAWERIRTAAFGSLVMGSLQLIALARFASTVRWGAAPIWLYLVFLLGMVAMGAYGLYEMDFQRPLPERR